MTIPGGQLRVAGISQHAAAADQLDIVFADKTIESAAVSRFGIDVKIFSAVAVAGRRHKPLRVPDKIHISVLCRRWRETQIVELHENFVTRRAGGTGRGCYFANVRIQNVELRRVRTANSGRFVFPVADGIEHTIEWRDSGNA